MISPETIQEAVSILAREAEPERIILFGSYARGDAGPDSDLDFLVVKRRVASRRAEMVRLRLKLLPLRIPVDVVVVDSDAVEKWGHLPGTALYWALKEGTVVYGAH